ncbi:MAG TPA: ASCH domain-containing protein [Vicinamibacteria bacterium]|nr:ASCH domain-containing protein [Vicinamibacteria bacterium]
MIFTKLLREGVRSGRITCSVRIWRRPHVTAGHRYRMDEGEIVVDSILPMSFADITPELARESGFKGVVDLLKIAKHGSGENVYLVRFHYLPPRRGARSAEGSPKTRGPNRRGRRP